MRILKFKKRKCIIKKGNGPSKGVTDQQNEFLQKQEMEQKNGNGSKQNGPKKGETNQQNEFF